MRTLLMATVRDGRAVEAEPVIVDTDATSVAVLEPDDGRRLVIDRTELLTAISPSGHD